MDYFEGLEQRIGTGVNAARVKAGLSQAAVAEWMSERGFGWHGTTVARVESGERPLRLSEAVALGQKLDVEIATLIGDPTDVRRKMAALLEVEIANAIAERAEAHRRVNELLGRLAAIEGTFRPMMESRSSMGAERVQRVTLAEAQALIDDIAKGQTE